MHAKHATTRRGILAAAAGLGVTAGLLRTARIGEATSGTMKFGASNNAGTAATTLTAEVSALTESTLVLLNTGDVGYALDASSADAHGIIGFSDHGNALVGDSRHGTGVVASTDDGNALVVHGPVAFNQAGITFVPAGKSSKTVGNLHCGLDTLVLATVQGSPAGVSVLSARRLSATKIKIFLTAPTPAGGVRVGYFVING